MSRPNDGLSSKTFLATSAAVAVAASVVPGVLNALQVRAQSHALASDRAFKMVDRTWLTGNFDLEVDAVEVQPPGPLGPSARPSDTTLSIFTTLPEQLGLTLESTKGPVEIVVIDHAEKPTTDERHNEPWRG